MSLWDTYKNFSGYNAAKGFFNPGQGYEDADEQLQKGWQEAQKYQQPYWQAGNDQLPWLNKMRDQLADPAKLQNEWAQGYETSPYAKDLMDRSLATGRDEASAMGLGGSSASLGNAQHTAGSITSQDRQQYLKDLMEKYLSSIGIGQNIYGIGAETGRNLGNQAIQNGNNRAGLAYGKAAAPGQMWGNLIGMGAPIAGAMMGGPAGAAIGSGIGKIFQSNTMNRSPGTGVY